MSNALERVLETSSPVRPVRVVTAASLFDGHDAAINIMRRILQSQGAEVIHLGHDRSVEEIVDAAVQEDGGDELLCLGYPLGAEANDAGFPILRSGKIASSEPSKRLAATRSTGRPTPSLLPPCYRRATSRRGGHADLSQSTLRSVLKSAPGRTRTSGPLVRSQMLYPAELRARGVRVQREHRGGKVDRRRPALSCPPCPNP